MSDFVHTAKCKVEDNGRGGRKLVPYDEKAFRWLLLRHEPGTDVLIGCKKFRAKHSPAARGYLHGVVLPAIAECIGEDDQAALYFKMKEMFHSKIIVGKDSQEIILAESLKGVDTREMAEFIDKIIRWAGTFLGLDIPQPDRTMTIDGGGI